MIRFFAIAFLLVTTASAQSVKLTFQEAVKLGLANNVTLGQQRNQLFVTQTNQTSGLLQMAPSVTASADAGRFDGNSFNQQLGKVVNGQTDFVNGRVGANVPIFGGFSQLNLFRQAKNLNEAQLQFIGRTQQDVIRNVAFQYLTCLLNQQLMRIDLQNVQTQKAQYDQINAQVVLGSRAEADLYNQDFQVKNAELLLVRSTNQFKNALAALAQTILIDPTASYELEDPAWHTQVSELESAQLDELVALATQTRPDLKQADFTLKANQFAYQARKGQMLPNLTAFGGISSRYNYIYDFQDNRKFNEQFRQDNRQFSYGLSLNVPIFSGFQNRAVMVQNKVAYENSKLNLRATEMTVKNDVLRAYQNYKDAQTSYVSADAQLKAAELSYTMEKERYDLGISNIVQLTTTQQALVRAHSDFASARYTLMFQKLLLNYATGTLKPEDIP
jgi:outer membrane protein